LGTVMSSLLHWGHDDELVRPPPPGPRAVGGLRVPHHRDFDYL